MTRSSAQAEFSVTAEIGEILAAGLMRAVARKSSGISYASGERSLHFLPDQSGDPPKVGPEKPHD